ncbi:MAG TPA: hypothetical protein PKA12_16540 [Saprospiraceae bacterium]|nr:hypothetical protein [Saprospiraceae bacterium]
MKLFVTFIYFIVFTSCNAQTYNSNLVNLKLENPHIKIPKIDSENFSDTLHFVLSNSSDAEYIFELSDTAVIFSDFDSLSGGMDADPSQGIIVKFLDETGDYIKIEAVMGFSYDDNIWFSKESDIKILKPHSELFLNVPLKFPSKNLGGAFLQYIPELRKTKKMVIVFNSFGFNSYIFKEKYTLKKGQKILAKRWEVVLPVNFKEN